MSAGVIELERDGGDAFELMPADWRRAIDLARLGGWRSRQCGPAGIYFPGRGTDATRMTAAQADALAEALERTVADLPRHDAQRHKWIAHPAGAAIPGWYTMDPRDPVSPVEYFSGDSRGLPAELAAFLRRGTCVARFVPW